MRERLFSFAQKKQLGDHDDSEDNEHDDNQEEEYQLHVGSCSYPSAAEEMTRLGLKRKVDFRHYTTNSDVIMRSEDTEHPHRKRKGENTSSSTYSTPKVPKWDKFNAYQRHKSSYNLGINDHYKLMTMFVAQWKEACIVNDADQVLERMLQFYHTRKPGRVKLIFRTHPFVTLLNVAVTCIKLGMWDNIYESFKAFSQKDVYGRTFESSADHISIDVEPAKNDVAISAQKSVAVKNAEHIVNKISAYFKDDVFSHGNPSREDRFLFLSKLSKCEYWLVEQYSIMEFQSLGYGEYYVFLQRYMHLFPNALQKCLMGDTYKKVSLEAHVLPLQLDVLLAQALNSLWENETIINISHISELLSRQFPLICFKLVESDLMENFLGVLREKKCKLTYSNCVLFSTPLLRFCSMGCSSTQNGKKMDETCGVDINAIEVLLKAPMLTDLKLWSHWDLLFAPSLGSFMEWLFKEVNTKELLCLVTKDGKIIRVDHSATTDSFLRVFIQGSAFETAVKFLSLFVLYGGERNVPLSLLKCHSQKAFEVMINNSLEELHGDKNPLMHVKMLDKVIPLMSSFILDCLSYLPIEFCSYAADVLISGLQSFIKDAPSAVLTECKQIQHRLILHEVGISLGLMEWVNDYYSFNSESSTRSVIMGDESNRVPSSSGEMLVSCSEAHSPEISVDGCIAISEQLPVHDNFDINNDPARVIESIRKDEFGLDKSLSATENGMLEKQHARLGRALHCLSQELYSQDSHFLLELVQNADDNVYPKNVEPTLTFILQEKDIIVLNNEQGFSANNIRALCDIGNSTKKVPNAGYIGKKGIGFKSVFRVTDTPEIHSNGFHIKFDITEGQIGFVLPTIIPPCNIELFTEIAAAGASYHINNQNAWKTCIVLPFRSSLSEGFAMSNIISMFSDLHPSLLLFLHRLRSIKFRNMLDDSLVVMRKQVIGDGIVQVALGDEKMNWFVVSQKLQANNGIRSDVQTTEISLAFTLQETSSSDGGGYMPILKQQPVFAFLPLRTYGLKFILQGDFVLTSSREEVDGNSAWNQWLLSEFPDLFVSAERSFCDLPCYKGYPGKAVTAFMSFIPLVGEAHGFFSSLPRMILSKLRISNCLLMESEEKEWVPPCKVLRNWPDQAQSLLPDSLLREYLGLGFLNKDIVLSDSLARALGVEDYGLDFLLKVISSVCRSDNGLKSMGLSWLCSWLSSTYVMMSSHSFMNNSPSFGTESDFISKLSKIPFIPLSDGKYGSLDENTVWLHADEANQGINDECALKAFSKMYAKLRIVSPKLLAVAVENSCSDITILENVKGMLFKVGVQRLSAHEIVKVHILPAISNDRTAIGQEELMIEYLSFAMFHLQQSSCTSCSLERSGIIEELREKALILTNHGFKRSNEVAIHFSREYGNSVDVSKLISDLDVNWHEADIAYMKHPITESVSGGVSKWRNFLQEIGVTDFVQIIQVEKNVSDMSLVNIKDIMWGSDMTMPMNSVAKNWESEELFHILSWVSSRNDREKSKYLLEILDTLWDDYFGDKVTGYCVDSSGECKPFKSSIIRILQDVPWIASNIDNRLHCPKELFHDCVAVNSVLGVCAPYTIPKVRSKKLVADIGLKTEVTLDDALSVLRVWRSSESHFKASVSQMSNFYAILWKEMTLSKKKIIEELNSGPFIFVPYTSAGCSHKDNVDGVLLSPREVYWHDSTGSMDQMNSVHPERIPGMTSIHPLRKMLCNFYPNLREFFVNECGVDETPPLCSYLQMLLQLSTVSLPHQAANRVLEVFLKWDDGLTSGSLSLEDVEYLKENLLKREYTVLPTGKNKWVSLHASFGVICWCDDDDLGREFKYLDGVDFLYFGGFSDEENQRIRTKVSTILRRLGIPALSEIVTREAIYYGPADSSFIFPLVNWILPYAQRYLFHADPDKYFQLKQSGFENIRNLKIFVVEKLFYRNAIKRSDIKSMKRHECNCILQDNIFNCSQGSDPHSIFLEFSRLLYNGTPNLIFANFLHMITTMAESGADEEQMEFFISKSQKVPKLPPTECCWSFQSVEKVDLNYPQHKVKQPNSLKFTGKRKTSNNSNRPTEDWKTAPGFGSSSSFRNIVKENHELKLNIESDRKIITPRADLLNSDDLDLISPDIKNFGSSNRSERENQIFAETGRLGELVAFKYFVGKFGEALVKWVNEDVESGLPYDIIIGSEGISRKEYVEVKATKSEGKNWFLISVREWQFAVSKGESYSIACVDLSDNDMGRVVVYQNPARLCQFGNLKLAVVVPKQQYL